jgi:hypothetical protein
MLLVTTVLKMRDELQGRAPAGAPADVL